MDDLQLQHVKTRAKVLGVQEEFNDTVSKLRNKFLGVDKSEGESVPSQEGRMRAELVANYEATLEKMRVEIAMLGEQLNDSKLQLTEYKKWSTSLLKHLLESGCVDWNLFSSVSIPVEALLKMAKSDEWRVREIVAKKGKTPDSVLIKLLNDDDCDVANAAAKNLRMKGYTIADE